MIRKLAVAASLISIGVLAILFWGVPSRAKDDWLPIAPEDLALKDNPAKPGAHAMILYREVFIDSAGAFETEYDRIKIFTEQGREEQSDVQIPYRNSFTSIVDIHARTIRQDGSIVNYEGKPFDKEIIKAGGIKILAKTFTLPDVQPGCIIEYKYKTQHDPYFRWFVNWTVAGDLYTRLARFTIKPDMSPMSLPMYWRKYRLPGDYTPQRQRDGTLTMEIKDVPGVEQEDLMPPDDAIRPRIEFFYRKLTDPENETPEHYWTRIGKSWYTFENSYADKKSALESLVSQTVAANDAPEVKLQKLYARVQQIRNVSYESEKTLKEEKREKLKDNNNVEDILKHGYGTDRQLNLLMMGLARAAGFESSMLYVAPRSGAPFLFNMEDADSAADDVVWVGINKKDYYLDPGSKFYPYGLLPWFESSASGVKPVKDGVERVATPPPAPGDAIRERRADVKLDADGSLSGTLEVDFDGLWGSVVRQEDREEDDAGRKKDLMDGIKEALPANATFEITSISGWDDASKPLHVVGQLKIPGYATQAGHRTLVPATIFHSLESGYFAHEKRVNPVYFRYPYTLNDSVTLHLPDGLKIESLPAEAKASPGGGFKFDLKAAQSANALTVDRQLVVGGILYGTDSYPALRSFFNSVKSNDDTQIILHNAQTSENR